MGFNSGFKGLIINNGNYTIFEVLTAVLRKIQVFRMVPGATLRNISEDLNIHGNCNNRYPTVT